MNLQKMDERDSDQETDIKLTAGSMYSGKKSMAYLP